MSDESLSENQVEGLLKAMEDVDEDAGGVKAAAGQDRHGQTAGGAASETTEERGGRSSVPRPYSPGVPAEARITAYDFKRPERVGKDQIRALQSLHETIARNFAASVSGMLRSMTEVKLLGVDQLTYSEFVFSLDNPSCFNVLRPEPLEGHWILDISPSLAYCIIDRLLGGDPVPGNTIRRPLTEIEMRLMSRVVALFLDQLKPAWENIVPLAPVIEATESNPQLVNIVPPNEVVILIGLEVALAKNRGMMQLCIPFNTIERYNAQLSRNGWVGYGQSHPSDTSRRAITQNIDAAPVDVVATLARSKVRTRDLLDLAVGDVITTEQEVGNPLELSIQEVPKFHAAAGAYHGKKAVRIDAVIPSRGEQLQAHHAEDPPLSDPPPDGASG